MARGARVRMAAIGMAIALVGTFAMSASASDPQPESNPLDDVPNFDHDSDGGSASAMAQCDIAGTVCAAAAAVASSGCIDAKASGAISIFSAEGTIEIRYSYVQAASATHVCDIPGGYEIRSGSVESTDSDGDYYAEWNFHSELLTCQSHMDSTWISTSSDECVTADASGESGNAAFDVSAEAEAASADCSGDLVGRWINSVPSSSDTQPSLDDDSDPPREYDTKAEARLAELEGQAQDKILKEVQTASAETLKDALKDSALSEHAEQAGRNLVQSVWGSEDYGDLTVTLYDVPG